MDSFYQTYSESTVSVEELKRNMEELLPLISRRPQLGPAPYKLLELDVDVAHSLWRLKEAWEYMPMNMLPSKLQSEWRKRRMDRMKMFCIGPIISVPAIIIPSW